MAQEQNYSPTLFHDQAWRGGCVFQRLRGHTVNVNLNWNYLNCYKNSFFVRIIKAWNDLSINVFNFRDSPNVSKFKLRLKNHMNIYCTAILYLFMILICFLSDFFHIFINYFL